MTRFVFVIILLLTAYGAAQPEIDMTLIEAQAEYGTTSPAVRQALELAERARDDLALAEQDPYSTTLDTERAWRTANLADVAVREARIGAAVEITDAYLSVLVARASQTVAHHEALIAEIEAGAARARFAAGAITRIDLDAAERALSVAVIADMSTTEDLALAEDALWDKLPPEAPGAELHAPIELPPVPDMEEMLDSVLDVRPVVNARHMLAIANAELAALHPSIHSRVVIAAAHTAVDDAERGLEAVLTSERLRLSAAHRSADRAAGALQSARDALDLARQRLTVETARFDNGLAAEVELMRAELDVHRALLAEIGGQRAYLIAVLPLLSSVSGP